MPIDPNVLTPTLIRPISVAGVVHDAAVVQEAQARAQAYRDKQMELARDRQENDQIRSVMQQSQGQLDEPTLNAIRQISPTKAMDIEKLHNDTTKSSMEIENAKIDHDLKVINYTARQLAGIDAVPEEQRPYQYSLARAGIKATTGQDLPEQYDPALVQSWQEKGMTYAEKLSQQREDRAAKFQELTATRQQTAEERAVAAQAETARHNQATEGNAAGNLALRRQEAAKPGASGGGEKKRGVTAGDTNKIAEYNTALSDLNILEKTIGPGATGIAASAGAALPNWATNLTGWGTGAKSRQATIDLVKQVIGKSLEGGVLRKEDEIKYAKILPTISDPESVVRTKIAGLRTTIQQKREEHFSALEDAGYDVSKFRARQESAKPKTGPGPKADPLGIR